MKGSRPRTAVALRAGEEGRGPGAAGEGEREEGMAFPEDPCPQVR